LAPRANVVPREQRSEMSNAESELAEVGPEEAATLLAEGAFLLDVREPDEWEAGHATAAIHIPLGDLEQRHNEVPQDRTIVCVCRGGGRSARAAVALAGIGYETINLAGGMRAWNEAGLAVVGSDGSPGTVI
jgi:rhodanese-related sulfurtransferase